MSTKIYHAYRIPKSKDILKELKRAKEISIEMVSKDAVYLEELHLSFMWDVAKTLKEDPDNPKALRIKEADRNMNFPLYDVEFVEFIRNLDNSKLRFMTGVLLSSSIFYDKKFWYIKAYPNFRIHYSILNKIEEELKWQDYHYQDQTDPPKDIPYKKFKFRGIKWDKLLESSGGNYTDGFQYDLFNADILYNLISKFYYTGSPLYDHLAYKFDHRFFKETQEKPTLGEE